MDCYITISYRSDSIHKTVKEHYQGIEDADTLSSSRLFHSFFFFLHIPHSHLNLRSLLISRNKCNLLEIFTQFMIDYFFDNLSYFAGNFRSSYSLYNGH